MGLSSRAKHAVATIQRCVSHDQFTLSLHFALRMSQRGLFWQDVEVALFKPSAVEGGTPDQFGRPKWLITGAAATGDQIQLVCTLETGESGVEFITIYWLE